MSSPSTNDSILILRAFLLDTQLENPDQVVIAQGKKTVRLSELFAQDPAMRQKMMDDRAEVYRLLGWEIEA